MTTFNPEASVDVLACPSCGADRSQPCHAPTGRKVATHFARITKYRKETLGPEPFDIVYVDGAKYRVDRVEEDKVVLRRGTSKQRWIVTAYQLEFDPIAGMWRR